MSYEPFVIPPSVFVDGCLKETHNPFINATQQYGWSLRNLNPYYGYYTITTKDGKSYIARHVVYVGEESYIHKERMIKGFKRTLKENGYTMYDIDSFECKYSKL